MVEKKEKEKLNLNDEFELKGKNFKIVYLRVDKKGRSIIEAVEKRK